MTDDTKRTGSTIHRYAGKSATILWDKALCIHVGECVKARGEIFDLDRKPWIDPDAGSDEAVLDIITRCPSGALSVDFTSEDDANALDGEQAPTSNTITVNPGGPLDLHGDLEITGAPDHAPGLRFRASLCSCGQSGNKPFCDNSHRKADIDMNVSLSDPGKPLEEAGGTLSITPAEDGPLRLAGNMTIKLSGHDDRWTGARTALCRCGLSGNKPFCDGSHRESDFKS